MQKIKVFGAACLFITTIISCKENNVQTAQEAQEAILEAKVDNAVSCTVIGLTPADSVTYMNEGGKQFKPTVVNNFKPSANIKDMV